MKKIAIIGILAITTSLSFAQNSNNSTTINNTIPLENLQDLHIYKKGKYVAPLEKFNTCKDMIVGITYNLKDGSVLATGLDTKTYLDKNELGLSKDRLLNTVKNLNNTNYKNISAEIYSVLNFYLNKNNYIDKEELNPHLKYGELKQVSVSCKDDLLKVTSQFIDDKEIIPTPLFNQN